VRPFSRGGFSPPKSLPPRRTAAALGARAARRARG
jgi:hypothetical protein